MTVAVQTLATSEYGALNDEVKKMSDQLSWGIKFSDVILQFAERVGTPLVKRAISLISEADRAGGKISDILVTAANDSREIKFLEGERKRAIGSYIAVIWTSYFVFLGVIVVLSTVFIPAIADSNSSDEGGGGQNIGNMKIRNVDPLFFLTIFYYGVTMQAIGNGCMAGLGNGSVFSRIQTFRDDDPCRPRRIQRYCIHAKSHWNYCPARAESIGWNLRTCTSRSWRMMLCVRTKAQVHILEMLTLFWLFFMSATFLIRVNVPDARSVAIDASLESAGEDAIIASMALPPELTGDSRLHELLSEDSFDEACTPCNRCFQLERKPIAGLLKMPCLQHRMAKLEHRTEPQ